MGKLKSPDLLIGLLDQIAEEFTDLFQI